MSRVEAISIMNVIIHMLEPQYDTDRIEDAVEKAIKALEQEPCDDAISRQAVLDKEVYTETSDGWTGWTVDVNDIKELPPVTPAEKVSSSENPNKWIPVSERYPEDGQRVLVDYCDEDAGIMLIRFNVNGYRSFKAWMPLPEAWRGE
jgi:hypothetical protein